VTVAAAALSACSLHVTKNGVSGNLFGHKFSAAEHQLPAGFPSDIPTPANSQVLAGGGVTDAGGTGWDVAFAATGDVASGSTAYQAKFQSAGYTISQVQAPGSTSVTAPTTAGTQAGSSATSTTVTLQGASFVATSPTWQVTVLLGSSSSAVSSELKAGQYGINITAVPTSSTTTTTG
jgi:hypothetical protein